MIVTLTSMLALFSVTTLHNLRLAVTAKRFQGLGIPMKGEESWEVLGDVVGEWLGVALCEEELEVVEMMEAGGYERWQDICDDLVGSLRFELGLAIVGALPEYWELPTQDVGMREGCRDGIFRRDGKAFKVGPLGWAESGAPYGEGETEITDAYVDDGVRKLLSGLGEAMRMERWNRRHGELAAMLDKKEGFVVNYLVEKGVQRLPLQYFKGEGEDKWQRVCGTLTRVGYKVSCDLDVGSGVRFITARK